MQYDEEGQLIAAWLPQLARLPRLLRHQPFAMTPEQAAEHGLLRQPAAEHAGQAACQADGRGLPDYYNACCVAPIVDPQTQIAAGPKKAKAAKQPMRASGRGGGGGGRSGGLPGGTAAAGQQAAGGAR